MKNTIKLFALACIAGLSFGCSTILGVAGDACDTALGGSKVGDDLCSRIDVLKSDEAAKE